MNQLPRRRIPLLSSPLLLCALLAANIIALQGCEKEKQPSDLLPTQPRVVTLKLVHDPELTPYLASVKEQFLLSKPVLSDGTALSLEFTSELGVTAARRIASGEIKADAWIASSTSLVNYTNSNIRNLGARQEECSPLFSTPVVVATDARNQDAFNAPNQEFSWNAISESKLELGEEGPLGSRFAFSHGSPQASTSGFDALLQLAFFASIDQPKTLSVESLREPAARKKLALYEQHVSTYGRDENALLTRTANSGSKRIRFAITTEQQVAAFNLNRGDNIPPLVALYPEEGSVWQDYRFCISDADWVTPAHKAGLRILSNFLANESAQLAAKKRGFRPTVVSLPDMSPLTEAFGVKTSLPRRSFLPLSGDVVGHLLESWPELRRPLAVAFVLDASGSMEGAPLSESKDFFRKLLARGSDGDRHALVSFSNRPQVESPFGKSEPEITSRLDLLTAVGGSAVYDGLRAATDLITAPENNGFRRVIVMITDGDDKNSEISQQAIQDLVSDKFPRYDILLGMVALTSPGADHSDLKRITRSANGIYREVTFDQLPALFEEVSKNLD